MTFSAKQARVGALLGRRTGVGGSQSSPEPSRIMGTTFALSLTGKTLAKRILGQGVNLGIAEVAAELCVKAHFPHHD